MELVTEARTGKVAVHRSDAAGRRAALNRQQLCPLCGEVTDRPGRFCSSCLRLPPPDGSGQTRRSRALRPWVRATGGLRWIELLLLGAEVLVGGAAAALVFRLLLDAHSGLVHGIPAAKSFSHSELTLASAVGAAMVISSVCTGFMFSVWMLSAYHDTGALGVRRRWTTPWAMGSWVVPLANLWWPRRIVDEMWFGSYTAAAPGGRVTPGATTPMVSTWWTLLLLGGTLPVAGWGAYLATGRWWPAEHGVALEAALCATVAAVICRVANGLLAMVVVDSITSRQAERAAALLAPVAATNK